MIKKRRNRKRLPTSRTPVPPMTKEHEKIQKQIERTYDKLRSKYPEIRGKVVDFVQQSVSDGIVYVGIRFTDKTVFSLRYGCDMLIVGADYMDAKTVDYEIIREYMKPARRQINYRALTFAFVGTLAFCVAVGFLQSFGFHPVSWLGIPALMIILWSIGLILYSWRYR